MDDFATLTQLGRSFGVSSHVIGKWLVEIGLRTKEKKPSRAAFERELVKQAPTGRGSGYFWVWNRQKTLAALEAAGHHPTCDSVAAAESRPVESAIHRSQGQLQLSPQARLIGPFEARRNSENGFEIVSGDGTVSLWGYGQHKVEKVVALLNLAYRHGLFGEENQQRC